LWLTAPGGKAVVHLDKATGGASGLRLAQITTAFIPEAHDFVFPASLPEVLVTSFPHARGSLFGVYFTNVPDGLYCYYEVT
jgi:hypothetical protein